MEKCITTKMFQLNEYYLSIKMKEERKIWNMQKIRYGEIIYL